MVLEEPLITVLPVYINLDLVDLIYIWYESSFIPPSQIVDGAAIKGEVRYECTKEILFHYFIHY